MLPAVTRSRTKRFTPSRLDSESRPFFELPPAFLCAIAECPRCPRVRPARLSRVAARNGSDLHFGVVLPMPLGPPIVGAALEFHDLDLLRAALAHDLALDLAAGHQRCADAHVLPLADEEDLVEVDDIADLGAQALDAQLVALAHAVLLTAR